VYKAGLLLMQDGVVTTSHTVGAVMRTNPRLLLVCSYMAKDTEVTREAQRWTESDNWKSSRVLVAADTNAKSHLWHSGREDGRGQELEAFILGQGLAVVNRLSPHFTFEGAQGSSNIDLTLAGHSLAQHITGWRVLGGESVADHNYVRFDLDLGNRFPSASREISKYSLRRMDVILLRERAKEELAAAVAAGRLGVPLLDPTTVDTAVAALAEALWGAFQAATPLKRRKAWKKAVPWWTPELSVLKTRLHAPGS